VALSASPEAIRARLAARNRINIASEKDAEALERFVAEWLASVPAEKVLRLDVTDEDPGYSRSVSLLQVKLADLPSR